VAIAAFLVHGLSVTIGHFVGLTLPERPIAFAAAIAFLLFAAWTWRDSRGGEDDVVKAVPEPRYVIFAVISSFVLAELGDKTMLATVALASDHNWAGVWIGATVGMVLADGVAIAVAGSCTDGCRNASCGMAALLSCCSASGCSSTTHSAGPGWLWRRPRGRLGSR
jgi:putative Ca2+/H+ antiporter (TMEM165/GDT1 family)